MYINLLSVKILAVSLSRGPIVRNLFVFIRIEDCNV